jgi:bacterioferritin-associated ferredoxin
MPTPKTAREYQAKFEENYLCEGYGILGMTIHLPCPFCAAPHWISYTLPSMRALLSRGAECRECRRSARAIFTETVNSLTMRLVQTSGDDAPAYTHITRGE